VFPPPTERETGPPVAPKIFATTARRFAPGRFARERIDLSISPSIIDIPPKANPARLLVRRVAGSIGTPSSPPRPAALVGSFTGSTIGWSRLNGRLSLRNGSSQRRSHYPTSRNLTRFTGAKGSMPVTSHGDVWRGLRSRQRGMAAVVDIVRAAGFSQRLVSLES
jgi:hypothetical protein